MTIARRIHLFPYRTQKLSSSALMILGGRPPGKAGRCRFIKPAYCIGWFLFRTIIWMMTYNKRNIHLYILFVFSLKPFKNFVKSWKKLLTKVDECDILNKLSPRAADEHWKLHSVEIWVKIKFWIKETMQTWENQKKQSFRQFLRKHNSDKN